MVWLPSMVTVLNRPKRRLDTAFDHHTIISGTYLYLSPQLREMRPVVFSRHILRRRYCTSAVTVVWC
jgi:hypothetical protein